MDGVGIVIDDPFFAELGTKLVSEGPAQPAGWIALRGLRRSCAFLAVLPSHAKTAEGVRGADAQAQGARNACPVPTDLRGVTQPPQYPPPWQPTGTYPSPSYGQQWPPQIVVVKNSMATAAMVLGIIALLFCWIPIVGVIAWPLGILGIVFGVIGVNKAREGAPGKGAAIAGLITSGLALVVCIIYVVAIGAGSSSSTSARSTYAPYTPAVVAPSQAAVAPAAPKLTGAGLVGDGIHQVGSDIPAGRYKTPGPDPTDFYPHCSFAKMKDDTGNFGSTTAFESVDGPSTVSLKVGDFVKFSGGCTWTKQ